MSESGVYRCNLCKAFEVPAPLDEHGVALMQAHLAECERMPQRSVSTAGVRSSGG